VLYAPLSRRRREVYDAAVKGNLRELLAGAQPGKSAKERDWERIEREIEGDEKMGCLGTRTSKSRASIAPASMTASELGAEHAFKTKCAYLFTVSLHRRVLNCGAFSLGISEGEQRASSERRNAVAQSLLPPFLFDWPFDERLLDELFARGHKVFVFSQFVTMLDVIEVRSYSQPVPEGIPRTKN